MTTLKIMAKSKLNKDRILLLILFIIFIFLRIFSNKDYYFIQGTDAATYLNLAKNFPYHTFYNNQFYLMHPPLYPYAVYFAGLLFEDHIAGIFVSLASASITFFIIYKLVKLISNRYIALGTLILYSISDVYIRFSTDIVKESFAVMLILASLHNYVLFLKESKSKYVAYSSIFAILLAMTTDHAIFLIPSLIICYFIFGKNVKMRYAIIPIILAVAAYSSWLGIRLYVYSNNEFYPAAVDGSIVKTSDWGLKQLLSPHFFKEEDEKFHTLGYSFSPSHYIYNAAYLLNLKIAPLPKGLRFTDISSYISIKYAFVFLTYFIIALGALFGVYAILKSSLNHIQDSGMVFSLLLSFIFLFPITQKNVSYRYIITSTIFLFVIISYGFYFIANYFKILNFYKIGIVLLVSILFLYLPFYYASNPYSIFSKKKVVELANTAEFINKLPMDGVMAQIGYTPELDYLSDKRVMAWPMNVDYMFLISEYNISYIMYGEFYGNTFSDSEANVDEELIKYVQYNPRKFRLLRVIEEDYPFISKKDHIHIYEVIS